MGERGLVKTELGVEWGAGGGEGADEGRGEAAEEQ